MAFPVESKNSNETFIALLGPSSRWALTGGPYNILSTRETQWRLHLASHLKEPLTLPRQRQPAAQELTINKGEDRTNGGVLRNLGRHRHDAQD